MYKYWRLISDVFFHIQFLQCYNIMRSQYEQRRCLRLVIQQHGAKIKTTFFIRVPLY